MQVSVTLQEGLDLKCEPLGGVGVSMDRLESVDEIVEKYSVSSSPAKSRFYTGLGSLFVAFAIIGIWIPGWPTVSWAVPAAYFFSISSEGLFRWTLTNDYFGSAVFDYYATGKTIPRHAKYGVVGLIAVMTSLSSYFVWAVSTKGSGSLSDPSSWDGADPGFGAVTVLLVGLIGIWYVGFRVGQPHSHPEQGLAPLTVIPACSMRPRKRGCLRTACSSQAACVTVEGRLGQRGACCQGVRRTYPQSTAVQRASVHSFYHFTKVFVGPNPPSTIVPAASIGPAPVVWCLHQIRVHD